MSEKKRVFSSERERASERGRVRISAQETEKQLGRAVLALYVFSCVCTRGSACVFVCERKRKRQRKGGRESVE